MKPFVENNLLGHHYYSAEIFTCPEGERIAFLHVKKHRQELLILSHSILKPAEFAEKEKSAIPLSLALTNTQVLQKEVEGTDGNDRKLLHKSFPNINEDEFYYQVTRLKSKSIVCICRKSYIDQLLESWEGKFKIISLSLGLSLVRELLSFELPQRIAANTRVFDIAAEEFLSRDVSLVENYNINGLEVPNTQLLPFCLILQRVLKTSFSSGNITAFNQSRYDDFLQDSFFRAALKYGLASLLIILLFNFLAFTHYFGKTNSLQQANSINRSGLEQLGAVKKRVSQKQQQLSRFTSENTSRSSQLLNELASGLPHTLLLTKIDYQPLQKQIKENENILLEEKAIYISGNATDGQSFTNWVDTIEKMDWVEKAIILSYGKTEESSHVFEIKIELK